MRSCDAFRSHGTSPDGTAESVAWDDLQRVEIEAKRGELDDLVVERGMSKAASYAQK